MPPTLADRSLMPHPRKCSKSNHKSSNYRTNIHDT